MYTQESAGSSQDLLKVQYHLLVFPQRETCSVFAVYPLHKWLVGLYMAGFSHTLVLRISYEITFSLNGIQIEKVRHFKYLGIWLSDDLTWSKHIESVCCKARRLLGYIYIALSPPTVLLSLFCTYINPKFFLYLNMDVLSGTRTSKTTRNYWGVSITLQFKLPPRLGSVTMLVSHMNYHPLNHGINITNYFIPLNF